VEGGLVTTRTRFSSHNTTCISPLPNPRLYQDERKCIACKDISQVILFTVRNMIEFQRPKLCIPQAQTNISM
jgi:hypothetical protein